MRKRLVALGTAMAMSAAAFTSPKPASAQAWVAPVVIGSVIAGGVVGAALASQPYYPYYRPRGIFGYGYSYNCGCATYYCPRPQFGGYTYYWPRAHYRYYTRRYYGRRYYRPYVQAYRHRYYSHRYYGSYRRYSRPHRYSYAAYRGRHRPYVRAHYRYNHWH
jgi:hypothetical protein